MKPEPEAFIVGAITGIIIVALLIALVKELLT